VREDLRRERLGRQLESRGITHPGVLRAMRLIPRERFVEEALRGKAYDDVALPIGEKQTISQPWVVARMTELVEPDGTGRVLEIGTGSGYQAAVLSQVFEQVYSVERLPAFSARARATIRSLGIENVHFKIFDGSYGWSEFAPYRAIVVTAAVPDVPAPLLQQLEEGGRLVLPLGAASRREQAPEQVLLLVRKQEGRIERTSHGPCKFVPLVGRFGHGGNSRV